LIFSSLAVAYLILRPDVQGSLVGILGGCALVVAFGIVDDRTGMVPLAKLAVQILAVLILVAGGVEVHISRIPAVDLCLTILWVVGLTTLSTSSTAWTGCLIGRRGGGVLHVGHHRLRAA
jgi:UDP-N-acetylmuramyl pentapeptide phosphotransferase/UDP-N-acetylglucosamine-1-phosphate transferase